MAASAGAELRDARFLHVGIFTDEKVLQLTALMETLSDQCLQELHQIAAQKSGLRLMPSELQPDSEYGRAFLTGLKAIPNWPTDVLKHEVERTKAQWPYVEDLFKYTVIRYLQEVYKHEPPRTISLTLPPLHTFVHRYYMEVAHNPLTRNLKYFGTFGLEKKNLVIDAVRAALFRMLEPQINYETAVRLETGGTRRGEGATPVPTPRKATRPVAPLRPWDTVLPASTPTRRPQSPPDLETMMRMMAHVSAPASSSKKPGFRLPETPPESPPPVEPETLVTEEHPPSSASIRIEKQQHPPSDPKKQKPSEPSAVAQPGTARKPPPPEPADPKPGTARKPLPPPEPTGPKPGTARKPLPPPESTGPKPGMVRKPSPEPVAPKPETARKSPAETRTIEVAVDTFPSSRKPSPTLFPEAEDIPSP